MQEPKIKKGATTHDIRADLAYTLDAIPNNPKALDLASRFSIKYASSPDFAKRQKPLVRSVDCYFDRAKRLTPKNPNVWSQYGVHLHRVGQYELALNNYKKAIELSPNSSEIHYFMGLTYLKMDNMSEATISARKAYELGYPLEGLKNKLKEKGVQFDEQ